MKRNNKQDEVKDNNDNKVYQLDITRELFFMAVDIANMRNRIPFGMESILLEALRYGLAHKLVDEEKRLNGER